MAGAARRPGRAEALRRGFTLLEVAVAVLVMALGVLGVLGLRIATLKQGVNTQSRAIASIQAADIFDRMRANTERALAGRYNIALDASPPTAATDIAELDLRQWRQALASRLPDGTGSVSVGAGGMVEVVVRWVERDAARGADRSLSFGFRSQL